jgi:ABC-type multidrug transport system fused ATPase/permease subunit
MSFLFACFSCIQRSFLDTIQYYLFEFNFLNPFKVLLVQGLLTTSFMIPYYFLDELFNKKDNIEDFTEIISLSEKDDNSNFIFLILLLIAYFITSVFKNIYIIYTIKLFSPMARALSESIFDTFIISYYLLTDDNKEKNFQFYITFIINIICSLLIAFFSCIYNELLILYYKGMEINTHLEIMKRSNQKMNSYDFDSVGDNCNYINNTNSNIDSNEKNNDDNNDDDSDYKSEYSEHS